MSVQAFDQKDCNTCANHIQGCINVPVDCRACLKMSAVKGIYLPFWKPRLETTAAPPSETPATTDPIDMVNHPKHYTSHKYETIDVLEDWFRDDPLLWQVGKYISRAKLKGSEKQDLEKARWYLERRISRLG